MPIDPALLDLCRTGSRDEVLAALRTFRQSYLAGGPPPPELVEVLSGCAEGLVVGRGDPAVALMIFYFDVLMYVPPGLRTPGRGPAAPILAALDGLAPRLTALRDDGDALVAMWAWHLLSWLPTRVPGLAAEALEALPRADRSFARVTLALAAASTPEGRAAATERLTDWLEHGDERRDVAAMVLAQLHGDPQRPERTPDAVVDALVGLASRERWQEWEAAPAREHGFYPDLAACLVRAGYRRAERTLPALVGLTHACSAAELEHVLDMVLKLLFQSHPYEGDARLDGLSELQRRTLTELLHEERVWAPRPRFYAGLKELGLPLGRAPLAAFLGLPPPPSDVEVSDVGPDGTLTLKTDRSPNELVQRLLEPPKKG